MVYILAAVGLLLLIGALTVYLGGRDPRAKAVLERVETLNLSPDAEPGDAGLLVEDRDKTLLEKLFERGSLFKHIESVLKQSGSKMSYDGLLFRSLGAAVVGFIVGFIFFRSLGGDFLVFVVAGLIPYFLLRVKRARRAAAFTKHLPDAMDLIQRSLEAGLAFNESFKRAMERAKEPVGGEFRTVVVRVQRGADVRAELIEMADRVPSADLRMFVTAVLVQRETGGNLPLILARLSQMIRTRFALLGEMKAETAQGRLSAYVLSAMPLLIFLIIHFTDPNYMAPVFASSTGHYVLWYAAISNVVGLFVMRRMTSMEV